MKLKCRISLITKHLFSLVFLCLALSGIAFGQASIGGIGARLGLDTVAGSTLPIIVSIIAKSPAEGVLKEKQYILKVNEFNCKDKSIDEIVGVIRGEAGTHVKVTVADDRSGKNQTEHDFTRISMTFADPVTSFNDAREMEVKALKKQGKTITKTFTSDCGNYFFNFNADPGTYKIRFLTLDEKGAGAYKPGYEASATVFDNEKEANAITLKAIPPKDVTTSMIVELDGELSFTKESVGTISIKIKPLDEFSRCKAMYIVVYSD